MNQKLKAQLIGDWVVDPTDPESIRRYGKVSMSFTEGGQLIYRIHSGGGTDIMLLTYLVQDNILVTNQPSEPREEKTAFSITPDGKLTLVYGDHTCRYVRDLSTWSKDRHRK